MALVLTLAGIFLMLLGISQLKKFRFYALLTAIICTILSIELLADLDGLTLLILTFMTVLSLPYIGIKLYDVVWCAAMAFICAFWLSTQEFVDGFVNSHTIIALGAALACLLIFDRKKRQTLCALVLLTSYVFCYISNIYVDVIDIALAFLTAIILTQNYTRSIDLMTIDS